MCSKIDDIRWMYHALTLAQQAESQGEVPVGSVLIHDNKVLGEGWNQPIVSSDPTAHAEIIAIRTACQQANNYRLPSEATLYVTLEPCLMCASALVYARIARVVFGATKLQVWASPADSCFDIFNNDKLNHHINCEQSILAEQCKNLLYQFFRDRRE